MDHVLNDVRIALRQHLRQPGFALAVVVTLAITVGPTTAVFSVVNTVLVRALPFGTPEELVWLSSVRSDNPEAPFSLPEFMDYRGDTRTLSGLAAYANWSASLAGDGVTERLQGSRMSANAFAVLAISPALGRLLNDADDEPDAANVVVVSHRLWQRQWGGAADVIGRSVRINGESFAVVGVLPPQFPLPLRDIDVITPLVPDRDPLRHVRNSVNFLRLFGRLQPQVDPRQAQEELTTICRSLRQRFPVEYARKQSVSVVPLQDAVVGSYRPALLILLVAVAVTLATALANLISLALVRASGRWGELSMRMAIGASRLQLGRQLMIEGLLLAAAGSALGGVVALQAIAATRTWAPAALPRMSEASLDAVLAAFVVGVTALVAVLLALVPLVATVRSRAGDALRQSTRGAIGDRWNQRIRRVLVVSEIAAALVLLLATIVLLQHLRQLNEVDPGFDASGVFQSRVAMPSTYRTPDDVARFYDRLRNRLVAVPGVERVGVISVAPLSGLLATVPFAVEGQAHGDRDRPSANLRAISPDYPPTVSTRLIQGRLLAETDRSDTPHVALVSEALAHRFLSGGAVGRQLLINDNNSGPRPVEIVGVLENVRQAALDGPATLDIYLPLRQIHQDGVGFVRSNQFWQVRLRSDGGQGASARAVALDPAAFRATFLTHLRAVDPDAAVSGTGSMRDVIDAWLGPRRFNLGLVGAFALTSILLAVSGLYGLVAYTVSQREREIGVRMAIGATRRDVLRMVLQQAAALGVVGAAAGLVLAAAGRPLMAGMAGEISIDVSLVVAAALGLVAVVLMAAWLPAQRAARIDPTLALRGE